MANKKRSTARGRGTKTVRKAGTRKAGTRKAAAKKPPARKPRTARAAAKGGSKKMKAYPSFDAYHADQGAMQREIIAALREFVGRTAPALREAVKWGNGCWLSTRLPVAYVYAADDYVQFGFVRGAGIADPKGLLEGNGQYVRHVKVRTLADIDEAAFKALLMQAIAATPA